MGIKDKSAGSGKPKTGADPSYTSATHIMVPLGVMQAAYHALQSYAHGNAAPALASSCAVQIKAHLPKGAVDV